MTSTTSKDKELLMIISFFPLCIGTHTDESVGHVSRDTLPRFDQRDASEADQTRNRRIWPNLLNDHDL